MKQISSFEEIPRLSVEHSTNNFGENGQIWEGRRFVGLEAYWWIALVGDDDSRIPIIKEMFEPEWPQPANCIPNTRTPRGLADQQLAAIELEISSLYMFLATEDYPEFPEIIQKWMGFEMSIDWVNDEFVYGFLITLKFGRWSSKALFGPEGDGWLARAVERLTSQLFENAWEAGEYTTQYKIREALGIGI